MKYYKDLERAYEYADELLRTMQQRIAKLNWTDVMYEAEVYAADLERWTVKVTAKSGNKSIVAYL